MKETFYFSHDYEPTSDPKIQALLGEFGGAGYGVYWRIIEMLHSDELHKLPKKKYLFLAIAKQMLLDVEQIESIVDFCIKTSELLVEDGEYFWANRVLKNFEKRANLSDKRSEAGKKGALAKQAIAKQNLANTSKGKESKVKESKGKENKINKESKHKHGEYSHILLLDSEKKKFIKDFGQDEFDKYIKILDEGIELKGYKYKSHYLAMRKWKSGDSQKSEVGKKEFEKDRNKDFLKGL